MSEIEIKVKRMLDEFSSIFESITTDTFHSITLSDISVHATTAVQEP